MNDYLPEWATADEATAWLEKRTGELWPLPRILEAQPGLSVWLDYSPDFPPDVFQGRTEGYLAEMVFHGDARRLTIARDGLLTMTRRPDGAFLRITPGARFDVGDLRIRAADLEHIAAPVPLPPEPASSEATAHIQPVDRWRAQEQTILNKLVEMGYSPGALPRSEAWKPGVKSKVRDAIGSKGMWHSANVFNKAWERLRLSGEIADKL